MEDRIFFKKQNGILSAIIILKKKVGVTYVWLALTNGCVVGNHMDEEFISYHEWKKGRECSGFFKDGIIKGSKENNLNMWLTLNPQKESILYLNILELNQLEDKKSWLWTYTCKIYLIIVTSYTLKVHIGKTSG